MPATILCIVTRVYDLTQKMIKEYKMKLMWNEKWKSVFFLPLPIDLGLHELTKKLWKNESNFLESEVENSDLRLQKLTKKGWKNENENKKLSTLSIFRETWDYTCKSTRNWWKIKLFQKAKWKSIFFLPLSISLGWYEFTRKLWQTFKWKIVTKSKEEMILLPSSF